MQTNAILPYYISLSIYVFLRLLTKVDDSDPGGMASDDEGVDAGLDEVEYQLPVVDSVAFVVANAGRVVNQEHDVRHTRCPVETTHRDSYGTA